MDTDFSGWFLIYKTINFSSNYLQVSGWYTYLTVSNIEQRRRSTNFAISNNSMVIFIKLSSIEQFW